MNQKVTQQFFIKSKDNFNVFFPDNLTSTLWADANEFYTLIKEQENLGSLYVYFHCINFTYSKPLPVELKSFNDNLYFFIRFSKKKGSLILNEDYCYYIHNIQSKIPLKNSDLINEYTTYQNGIGKMVQDTFIKKTGSSYLASCFEYPMSSVVSFCKEMIINKEVEKILFEICVGGQKSVSGKTVETIFFVNMGAKPNSTILTDYYDITHTNP